MTRETKIGLLVGLAFIIVIGILLSEHMQASIEPPRADMTTAGNTMREGYTAPGRAQAVQAVVPPNVAPVRPVPTQEEVTTAAPTMPGRANVQIGAPTAPRNSTITIEQTRPQAYNPPAQPQMQIQVQAPAAPQLPGQAYVPQQQPVVTGQPVAQGSLDQVAQSMNEQIVPAGANGSHNGQQPAAARGGRGQSASAQVPAGFREVKAESGDTLSKLAGRYMGGNNRANRDAIIRANPSLQANPDVVVAGRTYLVPPNAAAPAVAPQQAAHPQPVAVVPQQPAPAAAQSEYWYTVKSGDNLYSIARDQLGNANAWTALKELNAELLKGGDQLQVGQKLRLPGKPLTASASAR